MLSPTRREFLQASALSALALSFPQVLKAQTGAAPKILLRSSWQVVNIGDIAHTPGVLTLIERYIPNAEVILWASADLTPEVAEMEHRRFPKLKIVKGKFNQDGTTTTPELKEAIEWADFLLHGSGPGFVAGADVRDVAKFTKMPYGIYGITFGGGSQQILDVMSKAQFVYFRDTKSLVKAKEVGVSCPMMEFAPDGAFACDLKDDAAADEFLEKSQLEPGKFLCCLTRLRYTPYWLVKEGRKLDQERANRNEEMREHDHKPIRDAITHVIRNSDVKVLLCPEDMTQMAVTKDNIYDKLDPDVKKRVVWRDKYWLTDQALSTYRRSLGVFGLEMHSPIMALGNGIPALVGRFEEQTTKGFMWRDIGLGDWLFDFDKPEEVARFTPTLMRFIEDRPAVLKQVQAAQNVVEQRQQETMAVVRKQFANT